MIFYCNFQYAGHSSACSYMFLLYNSKYSISSKPQLLQLQQRYSSQPSVMGWSRSLHGLQKVGIIQWNFPPKLPMIPLTWNPRVQTTNTTNMIVGELSEMTKKQILYLAIVPRVFPGVSHVYFTRCFVSTRFDFLRNYNPRDIIFNCRRFLRKQALESLQPWYRGFRGNITPTQEPGRYEQLGFFCDSDSVGVKLCQPTFLGGEMT